MKEKIFSLINTKGPVLPVEVASSMGIDSFMAKAYLSELVSDGKIRASKIKIAESRLYYAPGQERRAKERALNLQKSRGERTTTYGKPSAASSDPELRAKREAFSQRLREIEAAEKKRENNIQEKKNPTQPHNPERKPEPRKAIFNKPSRNVNPKREEPQLKQDKPKEESFVDKAMEWLKQQGFEILEELDSKKNKVELLIKAGSDFGKLKFYIQIRKKKKITKMNTMSVYAKAMEKKCPGVIITNGEIAKSSKKFLQDKKGFIKIKQL